MYGFFCRIIEKKENKMITRKDYNINMSKGKGLQMAYKKGLNVGVCYYPEAWGAESIENDIEIMKDMGVTIVRMGEFMWSIYEKEEGMYDFSLLKNAVKAFLAAGIKVILGTPTATPPLWLYRKYPETIRVGRDNKQIPIGVRGHRCLKSSKFNLYADKITRKMAEEMKEFENVILWQIDNELEANYCNCPECREAFRDFLMEKYGNSDENQLSEKETLENINKAYGNHVWSGEYFDRADIVPPSDYPDNWLNPALMMDYDRFAVKVTADFAKRQADIIRDVIPDAKITTNTWFCAHTIDRSATYENLDLVSYDNYPFTDSKNITSKSYRLDMMRSVKMQPFCIMEELSGTVGSWMPMHRATKPGMMSGYAMQTVAHGADDVLFFRFRTARTGAEMFWHGILDQDDYKGMKYKEFKSFASELKNLERYDLQGSSYIAPVCILYDRESDEAMRMQLQSEGMTYLKALEAYANSLLRLGIGVDIRENTSALSVDDLYNYSIVIVPNLFVAKEETVNVLSEYVKTGGHLIITARSGVKDINNNCVSNAYPGLLSALCGAKVEYYDSLGKDIEKIDICNSDLEERIGLLRRWDDYFTQYKEEYFRRNKTGVHFNESDEKRDNGHKSKRSYIENALQWADLLAEKGAKALARYASHPYGSYAAITENIIGQGSVIYVGTYLESDVLTALLSLVADKSGITHELLPKGVEVCYRANETATFEFLFNYTEVTQVFEYKGKKRHLKPYEMKVRVL